MILVPELSADEARQPGEAEFGPRAEVTTICLVVTDRHTLFGAAVARLLAGPPVHARIDLVSNIEDLLAAMTGRHVNLAVSEIRAEPVAGEDLVALLRTQRPPIPLILLGEGGDERRLLVAFADGAAGVLTKYSSPEVFIQGVEAVLAGHRVISRDVMDRLLEMAGLRGTVGDQRIAQLSRSERDVLAMIAQARSIADIAQARSISKKTVRNHLANIYRKLELRNRTEAILFAARSGMSRDELLG